MVLFAVYLAGIRVYDETDARVKQGAFTPIVVDFMYKRRVAEVLLDFCLIGALLLRRLPAAVRGSRRLHEELRDLHARRSRSFVASQMIAFFVVGVYRGVWRHFGMMDTLVVARGVFFGTVGAQLVILYVYRFFSYSRTVFAIYAVLLLIAVTLSRASFRLVGEFMQRQRQSGRRVVDLRRRRRRRPGASASCCSRRRRRPHRRLHRRRSAQGRHPRDGLSGARRLLGADRR